MRKLLALLLVAAFVAAACGDESPLSSSSTAAEATTTTGDGGESTVPETTEAPASSTETTMAAPEPGTLGAMAGMAVEDPLMGTGMHDMDWADDDHTILQSPVSTTGTDGMDLLTLFSFDPAPAAGGITTDQVLVGAFLSLPTADESPSGVVVYAAGADGFEVLLAVTTPQIETAMLETTDYAAAAPTGDAQFDFVPKALNADLGTVAGSLTVFDLDDAEIAYAGEIECDFSGDPLTCVTLTDDGVWRPGDEGEEVEAIQEALVALGYLSGAVDGKYGPATADAVRDFQRDLLLTIDGKVGPETLGLLEGLADGSSDAMVASQDGFIGLPFGTAYASGRAWLIDRWGTPDADTGWYVDGCDGHDWRMLTWDGFSAVFTDRDGTKQFDGWQVDDLSDFPPNLFIAGGIKTNTKWSYLKNTLGAAYYNDYLGQRWRINDLGYGDGRFNGPVADPPAANSPIASFGTGTGGFESC